MAVQWGLAQQPNAFDRYFQQGRQMGQEIVQAQQQRETRNALSAYATNPNDQTFNALAMAAPEYAMQARQQLDERAQAARRSELTMQGAQGNQDAILQLWGIDPATAARFDTREREQAVQGVTYLSQAALAIDAMPEQDRPAAWADAIQRGVGMGFDDLSEFGQYSPQALQAVVARAGQMAPLLSGRRPDYMAIPEGGTLVDTRNPQAVQAFGGAPAPQAPQQATQTQIRVTPREYSALVQRYGPEAVSQRIAAGQAIVTVTSPDEARTLPSGTRILLPDGTEGRVP